MYYFAYGSNMNHQQMKLRCPSSRFIGRAKLLGYRFVYDGYSKRWKAAAANIIESEDDEVFGGLFEINNDHLTSLNRFEGYPKSYQRKEIQVEDDRKHFIVAKVYLRKGLAIGDPSKEYRDIVKQGAIDCKLPDSYIAENIMI